MVSGLFFLSPWPIWSVMFSIPHIIMKTAVLTCILACCALPSHDVTFLWSVRMQASAAQIGTTTTSQLPQSQAIISTSIYHGLRRPFYRERRVSAKSLPPFNNITHIPSPKRSPVPHRKLPSDHRSRSNRFWKNHTATTIFT